MNRRDVLKPIAVVAAAALPLWVDVSDYEDQFRRYIDISPRRPLEAEGPRMSVILSEEEG